MNVLLFQTSKGILFPILEPLPPNDLPRPPSRWGRLKRKIHFLYQKIEERLDYQERLCSDLRHAPQLDVYHPLSLNREESEKAFRDFLKMRYSKHQQWLWVDGVLALLGSLLVWVPGPNIFFFYPAARTVGHYLASKGAEQTLRRNLVSWQAEPLIDEIQAHLSDLAAVQGALAALRERYGIAHLETALRQMQRRP